MLVFLCAESRILSSLLGLLLSLFSALADAASNYAHEHHAEKSTQSDSNDLPSRKFMIDIQSLHCHTVFSKLYSIILIVKCDDKVSHEGIPENNLLSVSDFVDGTSA